MSATMGDTLNFTKLGSFKVLAKGLSIEKTLNPSFVNLMKKRVESKGHELKFAELTMLLVPKEIQSTPPTTVKDVKKEIMKVDVIIETPIVVKMTHRGERDYKNDVVLIYTSDYVVLNKIMGEK